MNGAFVLLWNIRGKEESKARCSSPQVLSCHLWRTIVACVRVPIPITCSARLLCASCCSRAALCPTSLPQRGSMRVIWLWCDCLSYKVFAVTLQMNEASLCYHRCYTCMLYTAHYRMLLVYAFNVAYICLLIFCSLNRYASFVRCRKVK